MTANEIIKSIKDNLDSVDQNLEQIQCDDCIPRQAVLEIVNNPLNIRLEAIIKKLPSVTPKPKTRHWIFQKIKQGKRMWCSNCNSAFDLCCNQIKRYNKAKMSEDMWTYCPWCGAKMVEPQESEEKCR